VRVCLWDRRDWDTSHQTIRTFTSRACELCSRVWRQQASRPASLQGAAENSRACLRSHLAQTANTCHQILVF
jgi:hypothetical protein